MPMLTNKKLQHTLDEFDYLVKFYKKQFPFEDKRNWREYDKRLRREYLTVVKMINEDVDKAVEGMMIETRLGRPPKNRALLTKVLFLKELLGLTNRMTEAFCMFLAFGSEHFSYKTIERAYSDELVSIILHNVFANTVPKKVRASIDGTGLAVRISRHYRKVRAKELKTGKEKLRKDFLYSVAVLDIDTNKYVAYATGYKSEKRLFEEAMVMVKQLGIEIESVRLDRYYSYNSIFDFFDENTKVYFIPKKNATLRGSRRWKKALRNFVGHLQGHLREYFLRNNSEANNSRDKRRYGIIRQRIRERQNSAAFVRTVLHNFSMQALYG